MKIQKNVDVYISEFFVGIIEVYLTFHENENVFQKISLEYI